MKKANRIPATQPLSSTIRSPLALIEKEISLQGTLLPEQFFTPTYESHVNWSGERLLMLAVLQEALHSYLRYSTSTTHRGNRLFTEAQNWFWSQEREYLYSFESVCLHLQLTPDYIRRGLQQHSQPETQRTNVARSLHCRRPSAGTHLMTLAA